MTLDICEVLGVFCFYGGRANLQSSVGFKRYLNNTTWLLGEKVLRVVLGLAITVWMARYLGPEHFGLFSYALSFVTFFALLANLGLEKLLVRDLLQYPLEENRLMGSAIVLRLIGAVLLFVAAIVGITLLRPSDKTMLIMVAIFSASFVFRAAEVIRYWFEAKVQAKYSSIVEGSAFFISVGIKITLILSEASVVAFAWAILAEYLLLAIGLVAVFMSTGERLATWRVSGSKMIYLLKETWPLILAGTLYTLYTRIDQIMLGEMIGIEAVGVYAAAVKLSEGWFFVPALLATSLFPALINARKRDEGLYRQRLQHLFNLMVMIAVTFAFGMVAIGRPMIESVFGSAYAASSTILILHIWGGIFVAMSAVCYRYFIAEGLQKFSFYRGLTGGIFNVLLNLMLIPRYGVNGAAMATVISQAAALYLFNATNAKTRAAFIMQTKALFFIGALDTLRHLRALRGAR